MLSLPDGTCYEEEPIGDREVIEAGDDLVCIIPNHPERYTKIHNRVITVSHVSDMGGIAVQQHDSGIHFVRRCFHRIIEKEGALDGFDEVFA